MRRRVETRGRRETGADAINAGHFENEEDAAMAYDNFRVSKGLERLNFPED